MNKLFTKIATACVGLAMAVGVGVAVANSREAVPVHATPSTASVSLGTNPGNTTSPFSLKDGNTEVFSMTGTPSRTKAGHVGFSTDITITPTLTNARAKALSFTTNSTAAYFGDVTASYKVDGAANGTSFSFDSGISGIDAASSVVISVESEVRLSSVEVTYEVSSGSSESIEVTGTNNIYVGGGTVSLTATPTGFSPSEYTWNSSNESVATVSGNSTTGTVTPLTKGTTTITASAEGTSETIVSAGFTFTVKEFGISLSSNSVSMKANKTKTITITPVDANGAVVYTVTSSASGVATGSVSDNVLTISSNENAVVGATATITVTAKDNGGNSGYHSDTKTVNVEIAGGYAVGAKVTELPESDTLVYLIANEGTGSARFMTSSINATSTDESDASLFYLASDGSLQQFNAETDTRGSYVYAGNGGTGVSAGNNKAYWSEGMGNSTYPGLLQISGSSDRFLSIDGNGVPKAYASSNLGSYDNIYAYLAIAVTPTATLSGSSVTALKGADNDISLKLTLANFTATGLTVNYKDEGAENYSASSSVATVTCGHVTGDNVITVAFGAVGQTTVKLTITRGSGDPFEKTFTVTVKQKPGSITITNALVDGYLMVKNGSNGSSGYTQLTISAKQATPDQASDYTGTIKYTVVSGTGIDVTNNGGRVSGSAVGTGVVRAYANDDNSVYADVNVKVIDDYRNGVANNGVTFNNNLTANAGDTLNIATVFATKTATTYFGGTDTIADSELKFSYAQNDYANAVLASSFAYACDESTAVGATENQTVYVYCTLDESWSTSFGITITQTSNPITGLAINNVTNNALVLERGSTFTLTLTYTPTNATNKSVTYSINEEMSDDGHSVSVDQSGVISAGNVPGKSAMVVVTSNENNNLTDYVVVSVVMDDMTYIVNETVTWTKITDASTLQSGDQIVITDEDSTVGMLAYSSGNNCKDTSADGETAIAVSGSNLTSIGTSGVLTLSTANSTDGTFYLYDGANYLYAASNSGNQLKGKNSTDSSNGAFKFSYNSTMTIYAYGSSNRNYICYNDSNYLFSCYASDKVSDYKGLQVYKKSGGNTPYDVTAALYNAIHDNFGAGKTYEWNESCATFEGEDWLSAGAALTGISGYASYKLNRAIANASGNEFERFLAKYDLVMSKVDKNTYDFLGRFSQGGINARAVDRTASFSSESSSTTSVIIIISLVGATAIGGYFFLRKKKHQ